MRPISFAFFIVFVASVVGTTPHQLHYNLLGSHGRADALYTHCPMFDYCVNASSIVLSNPDAEAPLRIPLMEFVLAYSEVLGSQHIDHLPFIRSPPTMHAGLAD